MGIFVVWWVMGWRNLACRDGDGWGCWAGDDGRLLLREGENISSFRTWVKMVFTSSDAMVSYYYFQVGTSHSWHDVPRRASTSVHCLSLTARRLDRPDCGSLSGSRLYETCMSDPSRVGMNLSKVSMPVDARIAPQPGLTCLHNRAGQPCPFRVDWRPSS